MGRGGCEGRTMDGDVGEGEEGCLAEGEWEGVEVAGAGEKRGWEISVEGVL